MARSPRCRARSSRPDIRSTKAPHGSGDGGQASPGRVRTLREGLTTSDGHLLGATNAEGEASRRCPSCYRARDLNLRPGFPSLRCISLTSIDLNLQVLSKPEAITCAVEKAVLVTSNRFDLSGFPGPLRDKSCSSEDSAEEEKTEETEESSGTAATLPGRVAFFEE
jgi:hypothetical protein